MKIYKKYTVFMAILMWVGMAYAMTDSFEDTLFSLEPDRTSYTPEVEGQEKKITLSTDQQQAIAQALKQLFDAQQQSAVTYDAIFKAVQTALESAEIKSNNERIMGDLKQWVRVFMKNLALTDTQGVQLRSALESVQELVILQQAALKNQVVDESMRQKALKLQEDLSRYIIALVQSVERMQSQDFFTQQHAAFLGLVQQLINEMLTVMPKGSAGASLMPSLGEPVIPAVLPQVESGSIE